MISGHFSTSNKKSCFTLIQERIKKEQINLINTEQAAPTCLKNGSWIGKKITWSNDGITKRLHLHKRKFYEKKLNIKFFLLFTFQLKWNFPFALTFPALRIVYACTFSSTLKSPLQLNDMTSKALGQLLKEFKFGHSSFRKDCCRFMSKKKNEIVVKLDGETEGD